MPYISFEDVEQLATIEQLAEMLGLQTKQHGRQLRCSCPVHGGDERTLAITPDVRSKRGSQGVFFCMQAESGGDRIGLVAHCMDIGQQDAAFFIQEQFGGNSPVTSTSKNSTVIAKTVPKATVPHSPTRRQETAKEKSAPTFDPAKFEARLAYTENVSAPGVSEADAKLMAIGEKRGKIYIPVRWPSGTIAGWQYTDEDGQVHFPKTWLPDTAPNIVRFKRPA